MVERGELEFKRVKQTYMDSMNKQYYKNLISFSKSRAKMKARERMKKALAPRMKKKDKVSASYK